MIWMLVATAPAADQLKVEAPCGAVQIIGGAKEIDLGDGRKPKNGKVVLDGPCGEVVIRVPRKTRLQIESISAAFEILDVLEEVKFESVSGSLTVWGEVQPKSVEAATVSGPLKITAGPRSELDLSTVSGPITVTGGPANVVEVATVSGPVNLLLALSEDGRLEANSHNGPISLKISIVPSQLRIRTFSGTVRDDTAGATAPTGPLIELETFSSNITIEQEK